MAALHPDLEPIAWLLGTWRGEGVGGYPTMPDFRYGEEVTFSHNGKPFLAYTQRTWAADDGRPLHAEVGYWRPQPLGTVEVILAHPTGVAEIYYGRATGTQVEIATDIVATTKSAKEVKALKRLYGLVEGDLAYAVDMAAVGQDLQPHLSARLTKVPDESPTIATASDHP